MTTPEHWLSLAALATLSGPGVWPQTVPCANLSVREAQVLLYSMPVAEDLRSQGMGVASERMPKAEKDSSTFVFWVYNTKRRGAGSVTVGYYDVNRCTATVTESETGNVVSSSRLRALQRIFTGGP